jgi:hypothetical protein
MAFGSGRLYCGLVPVGRSVQAQERYVSDSNSLTVVEHIRGRIAAFKIRLYRLALLRQTLRRNNLAPWRTNGSIVTTT